MSDLQGITRVEASSPDDSVRPERNSDRWKRASSLIFVLLLVLFLAYWPTAKSIVETWLRSETFTHGILILPISGFMIWTRRDRLASLTPVPALGGVFALVLLGVIWLFGAVAEVLLLQQLALVAMIPAVILAMAGAETVRSLAFPLAYLLFAVPMGEFLIPPLMDFTAWFSVSAIRLTGVPVFWEGRYVTMPTGQWVVAEVCSGLRYLIASLAVGCLFAYLNYRSYWRRLAFIGLATLIPIVANGLRAFGIMMLGHLSNMKLAVGVDHIIYGWVFFGVVILLLFWIGSLWREPIEESASPAADSRDAAKDGVRGLQSSRGLVGLAFLGAAAAMAIGPAGSTWFVRDADASTEISLHLPGGNEDWKGPIETGDKWQPRFKGDKTELHRVYVRDDTVVHIYIIHYQTQTQGSELIGSGNHIYDGKRWKRLSDERRTVELGGRGPFEVIETAMGGGVTNRLVWHWYDIGGRHTTGAFEGKLWEAWARLTGQTTGSSLIMVAADYQFLPEEARPTLESFLSSFPSLTQPGELVVAAR